ncbi:TraG family conjugative transposon ATPase [Parabacteroides sp. PF5-9]|uniref:TraG family conjugative transposon ATPase n=1 Tax=Parabacteroides sp. PF5-9 TaxID=1742404 RepID=UPI002472F7A9|nr:TraG family conjugative transposon ATPase [Parabacteroides sp. PF5-9]MDH6358930.1 archaellum biogenesis ATPase FlaH [Parabacteroides sp. PF5-9]
MASKKKVFEPPYIGIDETNGFCLLYDKLGNYSVVLQIENPIQQYCADKDEYYNFHFVFTNIIKILGAGYSLQKQDIFCNKSFKKDTRSASFLTKSYFNHFNGRNYVDLKTYLIITCEVNKSRLFSFDKTKFKAFITNVNKVIDFLKNKDISVRALKKKQIYNYVYKYCGLSFSSDSIEIDNFDSAKDHLMIGDRYVKCISLVDIELVEVPNTIKPLKEININGSMFPVDIFDFMLKVPEADTVVYNQMILIPNQRSTLNNLTAKRKKHTSMPDPDNDMSVEDIDSVMVDTAREGQMFVYSHFDIIIAGRQNLDKAYNYVESSLFESNIIVSKQAYNQYELFRAAFPGNTYELKDYDKFLLTSDAAVCLLFKERMPKDEISQFQMNFTDRRGVPIAIDPSDLMVATGKCNNRNKFILGPSGSGKSFTTNHMVRGYIENGSDVVIVDTGNSYSGLSDYYKATYITYTEEKPITMNPFLISRNEYNLEKVDFLKNLIILLWKGAGGEASQVELRFITIVIKEYYSNYFAGQGGYGLSELEKNQIRQRMINDWEAEEFHDEETPTLEVLETQIDEFIREQDELLKKHYGTSIVKKLSFNTFFEFAKERIPVISAEKKVSFDIDQFCFLLESYYVGGEFEHTLNNQMEKSLFEEQFIVFEIDAIKEHPQLFPIVTLVIMDVFLQKMRLKKNRKVLIIEEAWKAIASPLMAGYILYLYKTVRKFYGEAIVVTQELEDIIQNDVVKKSIINNSDCVILLDQAKFKDNYQEIAELLSLSPVEQRKIFTINQLDNKNGRSKFKEGYMRRGTQGEIFGFEVSLEEYMVYTTERKEKDALNTFKAQYPAYDKTIERFLALYRESKLLLNEFCDLINSDLFKFYVSHQISVNQIEGFEAAVRRIVYDYTDSGISLMEFVNSKRKVS